MKFFLIFILVIFYQNGTISSFQVFDFMKFKVNQIVNTLASVFNHLRRKVNGFIFPEVDHDQNDEDDYVFTNKKTKKAFCDVVEEEAAKRETEFPEYKNLRSEPTALMSTTQLATLHGKRMESHIVRTRDGYLLTLHRLGSPTTENTKEDKKLYKSTILLHHGLLGSSADWILLGPEKSLPYILSNAGCDVWLTNARGNYYSRGHTSKKIDTFYFWNFSFQEMGEYDLPAVVHYIRMNTNNTEQIDFIGHSMGATAFLVMLSTLPEYNHFFRIGILLAPLVYMTNTIGPLKVLTSMARSPPEQLLKLLGDAEFVPGRKIPNWIARQYCKGPEMYCVNPLLFLSGSRPDEYSWDKSLIARVLYHIPAGGSTNTILHFSQLIKSGKFHKFDDEYDEFKLSSVSVPIVLFSSSEDWLASIPDVLRLFFSVLNPIDHYIIKDKKVSHTDFVWGPDADTLIFEKVVDYLKNGLNLTRSNEV